MSNTYTWQGGSGTDWANAANWVGGAVPPGYAGVVIAGGAPELVTIGTGESESANPLTLGAAGSIEAVTLQIDGNFSNYAGVALYGGTTMDVGAAGSMTWSNGGFIGGLVEDQGSFTATGNVTLAAGATLDVAAGGTTYISNQLTVDGILTVEGDLSIASGVRGNGTIIVDGGTLTGGGSTALQIEHSSATFIIENGASLHVTAPSPGSSFTLESTGNSLNIEQYRGTIAASITGLAAGDSLTVGNSGSGTITSNSNGSYSVTMGGVTLTSVSLAPGLTAANTVISNGTVLDPPACYLLGTRLRTPRGEVAVEALHEGETVLTATGRAAPIRWIGRRRYDAALAAASPLLQPILFRAGSLAPGVPARDLRVSPLHAMALDGVLVPAMLLVNGLSVVQEAPRGEIVYFHIELDRHDVLLAEGAPAESFRDEDSRRIFDNARDWHGRGAEGPACAPKLEHGFALEMLRRRIDTRAGLGMGDEPVPGELAGDLDACAIADGVARLAGWARDGRHPDAPVCLVVLAGGRRIGEVLANRYRADLAAAGLGSGRHGFQARLALPRGVAGARIEVRRAADAALLAAA